MIFDEVDQGVGGAVADAVGLRLKRLAADAQVLVVTHSPQVAARAEAHWRISKAGDSERIRTAVETLSPGRPRGGDRPHARRRPDHRRRPRRGQGPDAVPETIAGMTEAQAVEELTRSSPTSWPRTTSPITSSDAPTISDGDYDALKRRNAELEAALPAPDPRELALDRGSGRRGPSSSRRRAWRADAQPRQRVLRRGRAGVRRPHPPVPAALGVRRGGLYGRAEDRRAVVLHPLREGRAWSRPPRAATGGWARTSPPTSAPSPRSPSACPARAGRTSSRSAARSISATRSSRP